MKVNDKLSVLFTLRMADVSKDGSVPIHIRLTINSKRVTLSLGQKILPDRWNQEGNCARGDTITETV